MDSTDFMPFIQVNDFNDPAIRVANLSTYIIPEFFLTTKAENSTEKVITWLDTTPCSELYKEIHSETLDAEL